MFWNAASTLDASNAEVSMNERPCSAAMLVSVSRGNRSCIQGARARFRRTGKSLGLVGGNSTQVLEIALVADKHNNNVLVGVVPKLLEPAGHVLVRRVLGNVVDEQCADSSAVVRRRDGTVALLASCNGLASSVSRAKREGGLSTEVAITLGADGSLDMPRPNICSHCLTHQCPRSAPSQSCRLR